MSQPLTDSMALRQSSQSLTQPGAFCLQRNILPRAFASDTKNMLPNNSNRRIRAEIVMNDDEVPAMGSPDNSGSLEKVEFMCREPSI